MDPMGSSEPFAASGQPSGVPAVVVRPWPRPWRFWLALTMVCLLMAGVVVATHVLFEYFVRRNAYNDQLGRSQAAREMLEEVEGVKDPMSFYRRQVFQDVRSSVVSIRSYVRAVDPAATQRESSGSGVVVRQDGHILTNHHVVKDARTVRVTLVGGQRFLARIVGADEKTDLALVKIDTDLTLHPIRWGDSDALDVGDSVLAVGNPYGLDATVTGGIVSAKGRDVGMLGRDAYENFIQTDAAINPGNSGGPLLNLDGKVIGINTAILSRSGGFQGIGLAVPSSLARSVMDQLIRIGRVIRGYLGVQIQDLTPGLARSFNAEGAKGVLVNQVGTYSPAAKAGLQTEDIIVSMDGTPMTKVTDLRNRVAQMKPGRKVLFKILRAGEAKEIEVTIAEQPDDLTSAVRDMPAEEYWGMELLELTPAAARRFSLGVDAGLFVVAVTAAGFAHESGVRRLDVITHVGGRRVTTLKELRDALRSVGQEKGSGVFFES